MYIGILLLHSKATLECEINTSTYMFDCVLIVDQEIQIFAFDHHFMSKVSDVPYQLDYDFEHFDIYCIHSMPGN